MTNTDVEERLEALESVMEDLAWTIARRRTLPERVKAWLKKRRNGVFQKAEEENEIRRRG